MAMINHQTISIADMGRIIRRNISQEKVTLVLAQIGVGKTSIVQDILKDPSLDIGYVLQLNGQTRLVDDFTGIPTAQQNPDGITTSVWANQEEFVKIIRLAKKGIRSAIVIDEITCCSIEMSSALQSLVLEGRVGTLDLWTEYNGKIIKPAIVCMGNRPEDNSNYNDLPLAFFDRVRVYELHPSANDVIEFSIIDKWHPLVTAYMKQHPTCITEGFLPDQFVSFTPRSGKELSDEEFLGDIPKDLELPIIQSIMGSERATEYVAFRRVWTELIPREEIYADPTGCRLPEVNRPDLSFTLAQSLSFFMTKENATKTVKYITRMNKEFAVLCITDAVKRDKTLMHNADIKTFAMANMDVFTDLMA